MLFFAASAPAYDKATLEACNRLPANQVDPETYYGCCCARCNCAYEACQTQCTSGRDKLAEIRESERRRDESRNDAYPNPQKGP